MLDYANPLNAEHALNRDLRYHFLCLPGQRSGVAWRNSAAPVDGNASMTNLSTGGVTGFQYAQGQWTAPSSTLGFAPTNRLGGYGEMRTDGNSNSYLKVGAGHMPKDGGGGGWSGPLTLAAWMYTSSTAGGFFYVIGSGTASGGLLQCLGRHGTSAIYACFGNDIEISNTFATTGVWQHIVATYDGQASTQQHQRLYVNGVLAGSASRSLSPLFSNTDVELGAYGAGSLWSGGFDDCRIYARQLSADEVLWLYHDSQRYESELYNSLNAILYFHVANVAYDETGSGLLALAGSGSDLLALTDTGSGLLALKGSGSDGGTQTETGSGLLALKGSGLDTSSLTDAGAGKLALKGSGSDGSSFAEAGSGLLALKGSGSDHGVFHETGAGLLALLGDEGNFDLGVLTPQMLMTVNALLSVSPSLAATVALVFSARATLSMAPGETHFIQPKS